MPAPRASVGMMDFTGCVVSTRIVCENNGEHMNRGKTQIRQINRDREAFLIKWMKFMVVLVAKRSVVQVWHETLGLGAQAIHRSGRGDIQRAIVSISPAEIRRLFWDDLDAIRYAIIFSARFLVKN